ncbi:MAG: RsmB/NOP family class I SAM-dependent RNA methyltransferase [Myxococcota bacterium]
MTPAEARLRTVPWQALAGLGPALAPPLTAVLSGQPAERELDRFLRAHRDFSPEQRQVSAEALFGVGLWRRRLRAHLPDASPLQLLAILAAELGQHPDAPALLGVSLPALAPTPSDWRDRFSVPEWIAAHLEARFGPDAAALAAELNRPGPVCLRAKGPRDALAAKLARAGLDTVAGRWSPSALLVTTPRPNLFGLGPDFLGEYEVQDEGSQVLSLLLEARPGDDVLDLCAGAGGKSLHLAALVGPQGRVHATDVDLPRLERLRTRASKAGARVLIHGQQPPAELRVPRVLVDAPCSELGALRRGPDLRWRLEPGLVQSLPPLQVELIGRGLRHLQPGGRLVYATCTLTREENEDVVREALARFPELESLGPPTLLAPHTHGTDGFFAAAFTRRQAGASSPPAAP